MVFKLIIVITGLVSLTYSKPVMVSFGTRQGPIIPAEPISSTVNPLAPKVAAPVYEEVDDTPNPHQYRPPNPHEYRKQIQSFKPSPNLILGTPLDIKYSLSESKYDLYNRKAQFAKSEGLNYNGPQVFNVQDYEIERAKKKELEQSKSQSSTKYFVQQYRSQKQLDATNNNQQNNYQNDYNNKQSIYQNNNKPTSYQNNNQPSNYQVQELVNNHQSNSYQFFNRQDTKYVPQIGIFYSSGLRYYVPQIIYYDENSDNSVYDRNDAKYVYHQH